VGYSFNATKVMQNSGEPVYAEYVEHVPPDSLRRLRSASLRDACVADGRLQRLQAGR
jgi:hypothetical protein